MSPISTAARAMVLRVSVAVCEEVQRRLPDLPVGCAPRGSLVVSIGSTDREALAREYGTDVRAPRPWGRQSLASVRAAMEADHADDNGN